MSDSITQLKFGLLTILITMLVGIVGYHILEGLSYFDAFYMTIITISTTGFKEVKALSQPGRVLTIILIVTGVSAIAYSGGRALQVLIEAKLFRRRRMLKKLGELNNHYIVCGYGRMGSTICEGLIDSNLPVVVVENEINKIELLEKKGILFIDGDATKDEVLLSAGIEKAKGFVAVIKTDADNVFATLSAKQLNPNLFVVARAIDESSESKLMKAGADKVVKPYELGGNRMLQLLLRPGVIDFIDGVARNKEVSISLEELNVYSNSSLIGKTLADSPIRSQLNIIIVAIFRKDGKFIYNPTSSSTFEDGDKLIAIGEQNDLHKLTELCLTG